MLRLPSTPTSWELKRSSICLSLDLRTCQLQAIPALVDGRGALNNDDPPVSVEEARLPEALAGVDGDDLVDHDLEVDGDGLLVLLMAGSTHLARLDSASFDGVPELRSLDASLNHIVAIDWNGPPPKRLRTLVLANNQLKILESLAPLGRSLRHLDVSLGDLESLAGIEALPKLVALAASGNRLKQLPPLDALGDLKVLDLQHNALDSADALAPLAALTTLKLSHSRLVAFPPLLDALGGLRLQHLTLYGNALTSTATTPTRCCCSSRGSRRWTSSSCRPRGSPRAARRASLSDAVGSVVASRSRSTRRSAQMRAKHEALVEALRRQQEAATCALQEYMAVTSRRRRSSRTRSPRRARRAKRVSVSAAWAPSSGCCRRGRALVERRCATRCTTRRRARRAPRRPRVSALSPTLPRSPSKRSGRKLMGSGALSWRRWRQAINLGA